MKKTVLLLLLLTAIILPVQVQAQQILFEHTERTYISHNVVYERNRQVTNAGFLDVHILTVPLNDPYISVAPVESQQDLGVRETALNLLTQAGAIGGINADFFGLAGTHTLAFGPVIADGQLMSISHHYNQGSNEFASFFLTNDNFPMLRYITPRIWLGINGVEKARVYGINKVANVYRPIIINRHGMSSTSSLSARFPDLHKIVVDNGVIIGNTVGPVTVPQDGFVIVMNPECFARYRPYTWIGMYAQYDVFTNLGANLSDIQTAIGGGGLILQHGQTVHDTGTAISGRHPRSAIGITADFNKLILMTVDGRGHSIGATHEDMANLLRRAGASEAMHFDGGGSSTMVAQVDGRGAPLQVVNRVSDGSQRRVINALGVFDNSTPGAVSQLVITPEERYVPRGMGLVLGVYGMDTHRHRIPINFENVAFSAYTNGYPAAGTWNGNTFHPDHAGELYIVATYGDITASRTYTVQDFAALQFSMPSIAIMEGETAPVTVTGVTPTGVLSNLSASFGYVQFTVNPESLGSVQNGIFVPGSTGSGYITAILGNVRAHLPVAVGATSQAIADFATLPAVIGGNPFALSVQVAGDGSERQLRARVADAAGTSHPINFGVIDFNDSQTLIANIPGTGPYVLERIYMVTGYAQEDDASLISSMYALSRIQSTVTIPPTTQFTDPLRNNRGGTPNLNLGLPAGGALAYSARAESGTAILQMTATNRGIFASDRSQWGRFLTDINNANPNFVVIRMDVNSLRALNRDEQYLFHQALRTQQDMGRTVFVVSNAESSPAFALRDGIRYIDLGRTGTDTTIQFWIVDGQIWYDF